MRKRHRELIGGLALLFAFAFFACRSATMPGKREPVPSENLVLVASLDQAVAVPGAGASISIVLRNRGTIPVAVCKCFGVRKGWFYLEFIDASANPLPDHSPEYDIFLEPPYQCLKPGGEIKIKKNIWKWYPEFGSGPEIDSTPNSFNLAPGHYRVRAVYRDNGGATWGCRGIAGRLESEWLDLEVPSNMMM